MNTEQKYGPKTPNQKPIEPTADNKAQSPLTPDEWQNQFLQWLVDNPNQQDYLFNTLNRVRDYHDHSDSFEFLGELFHGWIANTSIDLNKKRYDIRDFVGHLMFMHELRIAYYCFNNDTDYTNESEENGVNHE